jgi:hypothetical protein
MKERGIDAHSFESKEQLHIFTITDELFNFWNVIEQLAGKVSRPSSFRNCRIVWRFDKRHYEEKQLLVHIEEDNEAQTVLEGHLDSRSTNNRLCSDFRGSILCSYPVDEWSTNHPSIIRNHLNNHHAVILAPKRGVGVVLQSNGLKKSDMERWIRNKLEI